MPRAASSAWMRSAAASVTDQSLLQCHSPVLPIPDIAAIARPVNRHKAILDAPYVGGAAAGVTCRPQSRDRVGQRVGREIDLGLGGEAAEAEADRARSPARRDSPSARST